MNVEKHRSKVSFFSANITKKQKNPSKTNILLGIEWYPSEDPVVGPCRSAVFRQSRRNLQLPPINSASAGRTSFDSTRPGKVVILIDNRN